VFCCCLSQNFVSLPCDFRLKYNPAGLDGPEANRFDLSLLVQETRTGTAASWVSGQILAGANADAFGSVLEMSLKLFRGVKGGSR
jgi:hypothetical protein